MDSRTGPPAHAALVATGVVLAGAFLASGGVPHASVLVLASAIPLTIVLVLLARRRVQRAASWTLLCAALGVLTVNGVAWVGDVSRQAVDPAQPGLVVDVTLPIGYVLLFAAAIAVLMPFARRDSGGLVEAAVLWLACASLLWTVVVHPSLVAVGTPPGARLYTLLLVVLVSGVGGMVLRAAVVNRAARPSLLYMGTSVLLTLAGNIASALTRDAVTGLYAPWVASLWILGYSCLAAAAVHPAHARVADGAAPSGPERLGLVRLLAFGVALGLNPVLAGVQQALRGDVDWMLLTVSTLLIVPLVVTRIAGLAGRQASAERALAHLATHDELTGLANRRAGLDHLDDALARAARGPAGVSVLFLDVDGLKAINDTRGHAVGDALITTVAERLRVGAGPDARVVRFGGDEFLVVVEGGPERGEELALRLRAALDAPATLDGASLPTGASIGVAHVGPHEHASAREVVSRADQRMYEDKRHRAGLEHAGRS